jgi:5,10-methylenetetrahydrofolate reductase
MLDALTALSSENTRPLLCLEVNPPRGTDFSSIFERLDKNIDGIDFLNVTDSALARMKCAALACASILKSRYQIEPLVNMACRDRNVIGLQSDLLGGWALGVRSIVALTGDAMSVGDFPEGKALFEVNSIGLLKIVETLRDGKDLAGNPLKGAPTWTSGVVVNPNAKNTSVELRRLKNKKAAGAKYALSQPVFDTDQAKSFFMALKEEVGLPVMVGLLPFKSSQGARNLLSVPGIRLSEKVEHLIQLNVKDDLSRESLDLCLEMAEAVKPYVRGFHVISGSTPRLALELVQELRAIKT